jgi:lipoate-protein ligase A
MTEKDVRDIVRSMIKSQVSDIPTKEQIRKISREESEKITKKVSDNTLTEKEIKSMIKDTLLAYHKWMWEKKGVWMNQI